MATTSASLYVDTNLNFGTINKHLYRRYIQIIVLNLGNALYIHDARPQVLVNVMFDRVRVPIIAFRQGPLNG